MNYRYCTGVEQPQGEVIVPQGRAVGGQAVGILVINAWYPMLPGNVANASTYGFPVVYKILKEASVAQILSGDPALLDLVIAGGRELVDQGVGAVVGGLRVFRQLPERGGPGPGGAHFPVGHAPGALDSPGAEG